MPVQTLAPETGPDSPTPTPTWRSFVLIRMRGSSLQVSSRHGLLPLVMSPPPLLISGSPICIGIVFAPANLHPHRLPLRVPVL